MSGTWSRKRRSGTTSVPAPLARAPLAPRPGPQDSFPLPPAMQQQQLLLSRSTERMFEDAELSGVLSLAGRKLRDFPTTLCNKYDISDLVSADLSSNRLLDIPADVCELRSLESLRMCQNSLRRVPSNISLLRSLVFLDLSNNQLSTLPLSLFELPLEILLLTGNRFESIPREIRSLSSSLTELDLSHNFLKTIPADIALLKMLRVLNLRKNLLDQFPSELCRLALVVLDLSSNQFTQLPLHIRKMKTLVELYIQDNPLQSPPTSIVEKGREHIFKWMDTASGGGQMGPMARNHSSAGTLRTLTLGRSVMVTSEERDSLRKISVPERRSRAARFNTITGSDSGYASTADEHRLSHELGPTVLDDINEYTVFSPSPDEGIQVAENEGSSESVSLRSQDSADSKVTPVVPVKDKDNLISLMDVYDKTMAPVRHTKTTATAPLAAPEDISTPATRNATPITPNGNTVSATPTLNGTNAGDRKTSIDTKNNNSNGTRDAYVPPTAVVTPNVTSRPMSKVAPMVNSTTKKTNGAATSPPKQSKPVTMAPSKISPPSVGKTTVPRTGTIVPNRTSTSSISSRRQPVAVATKSRLPGVNSSHPSTSTGVLRKNDGKTTEIKTESVIRKTSLLKSQTSEVSPTSSPLENFKKTFTEYIGISLPPTKEAVSSQLADGVHLCNLMNALRPKSISLIQTAPDNTILSPMKAKRNVDSFVSVCKRIGVPDNVVCSSSDVIAKRNLPSIVKTVSALLRITSSIRNSTPSESKIVTSV